MAAIRKAISDERLGRPGGVRRPEPRAAAHARPQRRLRRKPSVEGGDHEWPDLALEAGAGLTAASRAAEDVVWRGTTPAAGVSIVLIQRTPSVFDEQMGYNKGRHSRMAMLHPLERDLATLWEFCQRVKTLIREEPIRNSEKQIFARGQRDVGRRG